MSRSSIFSFDTLSLKGLDVRAAGLAVALLLSLEIGVARSDRLWRAVPDSMVGAFRGIEEEVIAKAPPPTVVFMGSSRMRDAVEPRAIEKELALPKGGVLNLGLTGGTPYEALLYYERHRDLLKQARVLVVAVEDWYWNDGFPPSEVERLYATMAIRWEWYKRRRNLGDLVGGVLRLTEVHEALPKWAISLVRGPTPLRFVDDRLRWRPPSQVLEVGPETADVAGSVATFMQGFKLGTAYERDLRALVAMAREDKLEVIVTQVPLRAQYVEALAKSHPRVTPFMHERAELLAREMGVRVELFGRGTDLGIPDDRFYDYGHLTVDGCRRMEPVWKRVLGPVLQP